ncbi:MAG TPA: hypothetical protein VK936_06410 [Longimicrobiales bacterium]|nr:hypothetical protein [Longimicrobiales bacterium]
MPKTFRINAVAAAALLVVACNEPPTSGPAGGYAAAPQASVAGSPGDVAAMQGIVATLDRTWGQDAATYAAVYGNADFVAPSGLRLSSAEQIRQLYTNIFPAFAGTTRQSEIRSLTFLTGTLAVLDIDTRVTGALPPFVTPWQPGMTRALEKNILQKRGGRWEIIQHQQTSVAPGVP